MSLRCQLDGLQSVRWLFVVSLVPTEILKVFKAFRKTPSVLSIYRPLSIGRDQLFIGLLYAMKVFLVPNHPWLVGFDSR